MTRMDKVTASKNVLLQFISPNGLACMSFIMMLSVYLVPKSIFEMTVMEKYYISSTPFMPVFYALCTVSFLAGVNIFSDRKFVGVGWNPDAEYDFRVVILFLGVVILVNMYSVYKLISMNQIMDLASTNYAGLLKNTLKTQGSLSGVNPLLTPACCWAAYRYLQNRKQCSSNYLRWALILEILVGVVVNVMLAVAKLARYELMPLLISFFVVGAFHYAKRHNPSFLAVVFSVVMFGILVLLAFLGFGFLRGNTEGYMLLINLMGYGPASFNHLCAELNGTLSSQYAGQGGYTLTFLNSIPVVDKFINIPKILGIPPLMELWKSDFTSAAQANLNSSYTFMTAFGFYHLDLGPFVYPYVFCTGLLIGTGWRSFLRGGVYGVFMYPFFATTIALWFSFNVLVQPAIDMIAIGAAVVAVLEIVSKRSRVITAGGEGYPQEAGTCAPTA